MSPIRNITPYCLAVLTKSVHGIFAINPEDNVIGYELLWKGCYGLDEIQRLRARMNVEDDVLVVGAHIGTIAIPLARSCSELVAVEANPATFELLDINVTLNRVSNIQTRGIAASDKREKIEFLLNRENSGGSKRLPKVWKQMYYYDRPEQITIQAVDLDTYLDNRQFDVVVMDIEGSEYYALSGMQRILSSCRLLAVEFLPHHLKNVSGVSVEQFLSVIQPHFTKLTIPSKNISVESVDFIKCLQEMYDMGEEDEGLLFEK